MYYGPTLMRELGLQGESVTLTVSGGIGIVQFLAVLPAIVFIDRLGALLHTLCTQSYSDSVMQGANHS